jgi:acylphosphatase
MTTARFLVSGEVQGVGFRWFVARHSRRLGLHGHARNLNDGRVEVLVRGEATSVAELESLLNAGPAHAQVSRVERSDVIDEEVRYKSFEIM